MAVNLTNEIAPKDRMTPGVQELETTPTPRPTLTAAEREEMFSAPVGEEGTE